MAVQTKLLFVTAQGDDELREVVVAADAPEVGRGFGHRRADPAQDHPSAGPALYVVRVFEIARFRFSIGFVRHSIL